jgi:hypothetical protein
VVTVDGILLARIPSAGGPATYGGFGVTASRQDTAVGFPAFVGLRVEPAT